MAQVWAVIVMIQQWWSQFLIFIGMIKKAEHAAENQKISTGTAVIADPTSTEAQREQATQDLQNQINKNT